MILIVCPFNRPANLERVLDLWRRQRMAAELLLVGGEDSSWATDAKAAGAHTIWGLRSIGAARSAGQAYGRAIGAEWVVQWDDDNYYGPEYVSRIFEAATTSVDVVCLGLGFVRLSDGLLYRFPRLPSFFPGHSTAVRLSAAPGFPHISRGEDVAWSASFETRPRVRWLDPWGLVYNRMGDGHAYDAEDAEVLQSFGPAFRLGSLCDSYVDTHGALPTGELVSASRDAVFDALERRFNRLEENP